MKRKAFLPRPHEQEHSGNKLARQRVENGEAAIAAKAKNTGYKGCRMSTQSFREDGFVSFHDAPAGEGTAAAKGLLIGLALSQVFWIGLALIIF